MQARAKAARHGEQCQKDPFTVASTIMHWVNRALYCKLSANPALKLSNQLIHQYMINYSQMSYLSR